MPSNKRRIYAQGLQGEHADKPSATAFAVDETDSVPYDGSADWLPFYRECSKVVL